jgi:hypothetical protein
MSSNEMFMFVGRLCREGETGWWTWHEHLKRQVFVFLVFGFMSSDLMVGNPACGARSVLNSISPCRHCEVSVDQLDNPDFDLKSHMKTPQLIDKMRSNALQVNF